MLPRGGPRGRAVPEPKVTGIATRAAVGGRAAAHPGFVRSWAPPAVTLL